MLGLSRVWLGHPKTSGSQLARSKCEFRERAQRYVTAGVGHYHVV
jgi:hypothetical protein